MSIRLMSLVWDLDLPAGEKLVLLALADQANDDGLQCWPSIATIGKRSGQGERTVRRLIRSLEEKGHLTAHHRDGASSQYHVHPGQIGTPAKMAPRPKRAATPAKLAPKPLRTTNNKNTETREHEMPDDWQPREFGVGTKSRAVIDGWPPGELAGHLEHFTAHHRSRGSKFKDWQEAWSTWVLNSQKFGARNGTSQQNRTTSEPRNPLVRAVARRKAERAAGEFSEFSGRAGSGSESGGRTPAISGRWD